MISDFQRMNFEVHHLLTEGAKEKCVDIALAVEMLYMATVPDGYDIAVIITGDKDFIPALHKTRMKGKRVAVCSIRNSCNRDLTHSDDKIKDFDNIWLDDYLDILIVPKVQSNEEGATLSDAALVEIIRNYLKVCPNNAVSSRELGRYLQDTSLDVGVTALSLLKKRYASLRAFVEKQYQDFDMEAIEHNGPSMEFRVLLLNEEDEDDQDDDAIGADDEQQQVSQSSGMRRKIWSPTGTGGRFSSLSVPAIREILRHKDQKMSQLPVVHASPKTAEHNASLPERSAALASDDAVDAEYEEVSDSDDEDSVADVMELRAGASGSDDDTEWLVKLVSQMLDSASPGSVMSSRNIGRYLKTHPAVGGGTALSRLKRDFGSLHGFLVKFDDFFEVVTLDSADRQSNNEFGVRWRSFPHNR